MPVAVNRIAPERFVFFADSTLEDMMALADEY
jgi:hypothetical protein